MTLYLVFWQYALMHQILILTTFYKVHIYDHVLGGLAVCANA
jgi:hypothetical protein